MRSGASSSSRACWISSRARLRVVEVAGPLGLVEHQRLAGVAGHGLDEGSLVAALGHADPDPAAAEVGEQVLEGGDVGRQLRDKHLARDGVGLGGIELQEEVLDQLGRAALLDPVGHPAALAADPAAAHVEDLDRDLERVLGQRHDVGVGAVAEHDRLLLERPVERPEVVAQPRGPLEVEARRRRRTSASGCA